MGTVEGMKVRALADKISTAPKASDHFEAVRAQCIVAVRLYTGVLQLVSVEDGISAQALLRTLFETIVGAVILSKHPEKLGDFSKHGKLTLLRMARSMDESSAFAKKHEARSLKKAADAECATLIAHFRPTHNWHMLKRKDAFDEAELPKNFYEAFYARASAVAHGEPFTVFQHKDPTAATWKIEPRYNEWAKWPMLAYVMSMLLMLHMVGYVSKTFALGLGSEWSAVSAEVHALATGQMESAKNLPDVE